MTTHENKRAAAAAVRFDAQATNPSRYAVHLVGLPDTGGCWISSGHRSAFADGDLAYAMVDKQRSSGQRSVQVFTVYVQPTPPLPDTVYSDPEHGIGWWDTNRTDRYDLAYPVTHDDEGDSEGTACEPICYSCHVEGGGHDPDCWRGEATARDEALKLKQTLQRAGRFQHDVAQLQAELAREDEAPTWIGEREDWADDLPFGLVKGPAPWDM